MPDKKNKPDQQGSPISNKKDVKKNADPHIDQDFKNYPDPPSKNSMIKPKSTKEKEIAGTDHKDGEKMSEQEKKKAKETNEQDSDGSAGAFEATEETSDEIKNKDAKTISDH